MPPISAALPAQSALIDASLKRMIAVLGVLYAVVLVAYATIVEGQFDSTDHPVGRDFMNYWSAPALALKGQITAIFDPMQYHLAQEAMIGRKFEFHVWSYPPTLLFLLLPLGMLPYFLAFAVWTVAGWVLWARVALGRHWRSATGLAFILAPAALVNAFFGQNGFLTALLFVDGFKLVMARPLLAGLLFGLLTFKPQIGLLIPVALAAAGRYRAIAAAAVSAVFLALAAGVVLGWESWTGYLNIVAPFQREAVETASGAFENWVTTPFMAIRQVGLPIALCYAVQAAVTAVAVVLTWRVWRSDRPFDLKLAFLTAAALLATPYAMAYDLTIPTIGALLFFLHLQRTGFNRPDVFALLALWTLPLLLPAFNAFFPFGGAIVLGVFCWRVYRHREPAPAPAPALTNA